MTAGADIPDSQVLKLIINRLPALEKEKEQSIRVTYTRHLERRIHRLEKEMHLKDGEWASRIISSSLT